jgi:hypothetical protein
MADPTEGVTDPGSGSGTASTTGQNSAMERRTLDRIRIAVYVLGSLLATSLLVVGTVAIIAEIKGTWHWAIHLESTISYMAVVIGALLALLVPLSVVLVVGRWWSDD